MSTALIALILGVFAFLCVQGFNTVLDQTRTKAQAAAEIAAKENQLLLGGAKALLQTFLANLAADPSTPASGIAPAAIASIPELMSFGLYDASGVAVNGHGSKNLPTSIAQFEFFAGLAGGAKEAVVSRQLADAASGDPIFVVAQALPGDPFAGVALLVISGRAMEDFWEPLKLGPGSTTSILTEDGWVVARYPALPETADSSKAPVFTTLKDTETGTYLSDRSPVDGIARVVGFRRLPDLGVVAVTAVSVDAAYAALWTAIVTVLWLIIPIAIALLVGSLITAAILRKSERTQASLAAAVQHNEVLFREIHHRVKNNLQSVASLLQMQPIPREIKADMGQRLAAMSAVHEHIYRSRDFAAVQIKPYIETLIQNIRGGSSSKVQVVEQIDDLRIDKDAATPLGLILNEIVSNAFKHAFADGRAGVIKVELKKLDDAHGRLTVTDNGVGFDPALPAKGIGQRLIRALTEQLQSKLEVTSSADGGSAFALSFPLAK